MSALSVKIGTMATIDPFTTKTNSDCDPNPIPPSIHTTASITTVTGSKNRVGTSVEVPSTPPRVQNDAPEPLGGEKDPAPIVPASPRQVNLSRLSLLESKFDDGYDSDGERGPWCDVIGLEGEQDYDEDEIPEIQVEGVMEEEDVNVSEACSIDTEDTPPLPADDHIPIEEDAVKKMKMSELKDELKKRRQPISGNNATLVERLLSALSNKIPVGNKKNHTPKKSDKSKGGGIVAKSFPDTAYWRVLKPKNEKVDEPNNATFKNPRAPTIPEIDAEYVPTKHDFDTHITRPVFTGKQDARCFSKASF